MDIVPWARLHARGLQDFLLPFQKSGVAYSTRKVVVPPGVRRSLLWWRTPAIKKGVCFAVKCRVQITTDASLRGWGAHMGAAVAQGVWSRQESLLPINILELRAIFLALKHFRHQVSGSHVLILTDNITAKAHVNKQGGTRSSRLLQEAVRLGLWAERWLLSLSADYISGKANTKADWLSRSQIDQHEWRLNPRVFQLITARFGVPLLDLFAAPQNAQLRRFYTRFPAPGAEATNALRTRWPRGLLYAFPPIPLISKVLRKMVEESAELILVAPHWPRRAWFADLTGLSICPVFKLPSPPDLLTQGEVLHPEPQWLQLAVWRLSANP